MQPLVAEKQKGKTASSLFLITRLEARSGIAAWAEGEKPLGESHTKKEREDKSSLSFGNPLGARTQDPHIKSVMLYQLS